MIEQGVAALVLQTQGESPPGTLPTPSRRNFKEETGLTGDVRWFPSCCCGYRSQGAYLGNTVGAGAHVAMATRSPNLVSASANLHPSHNSMS